MHRTGSDNPEPVGRRLARFATLLGVVFCVTIAVVVVQRFNDETLAFIIGGLFVAALIAVPLVAIVSLGVAYLRFRQSRPPQQYVQTPPIIMQMPPQLPYYGGGNGYHNTPPELGSPRTWEVIGGED